MAIAANAYSVVIPAFNAEQTLAPAIESVLAQSVVPRQIIIVDDGSSDDTATVARGFGPIIRYMHQSNRGPGAATTKGLAEVTTPIVATLDSDDLWHQEKAERQLEHLEDNPDISANFTLLELFSSESDDARTGRVTPGWSRTTMMLRMDLYHRVGEMRDPPGMRGELVDWIARARELGARLEMLEEVLAYRRIRAGSLSDRRVAEQDRGYVHAARAAIERRRSKTSGR